MELATKYSPAEVEAKWYEYWTKHKLFASKPDSREPYTIVIPPPNVTGVLHMGHMLNNTIQDILIRKARLDGKNACWVPGTDHASIATEAKVVNRLAEQGIKKRDLTRDEFLKHAWAWTEEHGGIILKQLRKLGASCDWDRTAFTMDEKRSESVLKVFCDLYDKGLIYRGLRMVNWDPKAQTVLSTEEVIYRDEKSKLYYLKYYVADADASPVVPTGEEGEVLHKDNKGYYAVVATTRPETIMGDTAMCINPKDPKNQWLRGHKVIVPLVGRVIPVIEDRYVDIEFGTGCLKVTPAHDVNDYQLGKTHNLETIDIFNPDGTISEQSPLYVGMDRMDVRKQIVKDLGEADLLEKVEDYENKVGYSERNQDTAVEPRLCKQWFLSMKHMADIALPPVLEGKLKFHPTKYVTTYRNWLENIQDWCISRQLWWGHQIPVWYCEECGEMIVSREDPTKCTKCGSTKLRRDPDVLDTWFSSQLWPFSTLGWPEKTPELAKYYPTTLMETGFDIIFFWVARMIMMGYKFMGEKPFGKVFFHGLVRDKFGQKMSKSKGNVIDPLVVTEKYGADALRFTFAMMPLAGRDVKLSDEWFEGYWAFINKIYNATRFCLMQFAEGEKLDFNPVEYKNDDFAFADKWILSKLETATEEVRKNLDEMRLNDAAGAIYHFFWHEFCDWYIELVKPTFFGTDENAKAVSKRVLLKVLDASLKLLHPFMPHVTEELWQSLPFSFDGREESIMISRFPEVGDCPVFERDPQTMEEIIEIITVIRTIRAENNIKPSAELPLKLDLADELKSALSEKLEYIIKLARVKDVEFVSGFTPDKETASSLVKGGTLYIPLAGFIDFTDEIKRLEKEIAKIKKDFELCDKKLNNPNFLSKAQPEVVEKEKSKHTELSENLAHLKARLAEISK